MTNRYVPIKYTRLIGDACFEADTDFLEQFSDLFVRETIYWFPVLIYGRHVTLRSLLMTCVGDWVIG
jgi:hypothetical protein